MIQHQCHSMPCIHTVSRNEFIHSHSIWSSTPLSWTHASRQILSTCKNIRVIPANSRQYKTQSSYKLTGLKINELVESSEARETWLELVVACVNPQPPDYRLQRFTTNFRLNWQRFEQGHQALVFTSSGMCSWTKRTHWTSSVISDRIYKF